MKTYPEWLEEQNRKSYMRHKEDFAARLFAYTLVGIFAAALWMIAVSVGG